MNKTLLYLGRLSILLCLLVGGVNSVYSDTYTHTLTSTDKFNAIDNTTVTLSDGNNIITSGVSWTVTPTWGTTPSAQNVDGTKGQQYGSNGKAASSLVFTTSYDFGTITGVTINASTASSATATVSVKVGSTDLECNSSTSVSLTTSATDYSFTTSGATGGITITLSQPSTTKALYVKSLSVTYASSSGATYTVTLADDGTELPQASSGASITLPSRSDIGSWTFAGWSTTDLGSTRTTTAPTLITAGSYTPTADQTLYPVYKKTETTSGGSTLSPSVTIKDYASANSWSNGTQYTSLTVDANITATASSKGNNGKYYTASPGTWRFYQTDSGTLTITAASGATLSSVKFTYSVSNNGILKCGDDVLTSGTAYAVSGSSAEFSVANSGTATNGQVLISAIEVSYTTSGSVTTTTYTSVPLTEATVSASNLTLAVGATGSSTLSTEATGLAYTYSSSDTGVATVDSSTGVVTAQAVGSATITVAWAATDTYKAGSTTFTVTVTPSSDASVYYYEKVNDQASLTSGGQYLIVYETGSKALNGALGANMDQTSNTVDVTIVDETITGALASQEFTITETATDEYSIQNNYTGYYIGNSTANNSLKAHLTTVYRSNIDISSGKATIKALDNTTASYMSFNKNAGQTRFRYMTTDQENVALYKKAAGTSTIYVKSDYAPYLYAYLSDETKLLGDWPGTVTSETETIGGVEWKRMVINSTDFYLILNDNYGGQYPASGQPGIHITGGDNFFIYNCASETYGNSNSTAVAVEFAQVSATDVSVTVDGVSASTTVSATPEGLSFTYTSGDTSLATVDGSGTVSPVAEGSTTVTVSWPTTLIDDTYYVGGSTTFNVIVNAAATAVTYVKVTDQSQIKAGPSYVVVGSGVDAAMGAKSGNFRAAVAVDRTTVDGTTAVTFKTDAGVALINFNEVSDGVYNVYLSDEDTYLKAKGADETNLDVTDDGTATLAQWSRETNATVTAASTENGYYLANKASAEAEKNRFLGYNSADGGRFGHYAATNKKGFLYINSNDLGMFPTITVSPGTLWSASSTMYDIETDGSETVTITSEDASATIYYSLDGGETYQVYTGPITGITKYTKVRAYTVNGDKTSTIATKDIRFYVTPPVFNHADGTSFSEEYSVELSSTKGYSIYYIDQDNKIFYNAATDGKTTTYTGRLSSSAVAYTSALTYAQSMLVTAVCVDSYGNVSGAVQRKYTYTGNIEPPYSASFTAGTGDFSVTDEAASGYTSPTWAIGQNTGVDAVTRWGEERYYAAAKGTNGSTASAFYRYVGTTAFTSGLIDLTKVTSPSFYFIHAGHGWYQTPNTTDNGGSTATNAGSTSGDLVLDDSRITNSCRVYIDVCDATGAVQSSVDISDQVSWFEQKFRSTIAGVSSDQKSVESGATSRSGVFERHNSGNIDLSSYTIDGGGTGYIKIRFQYTSTTSDYGTWNVDQITIDATQVEQKEMNSVGWITYVFDHNIDAYQTTQDYLDENDDYTLRIFKVTEFDHNYVVLQQLGLYSEKQDDSERYLLAGTPVIINGPASTNINYVTTTSDDAAYVQNNCLKASLYPNPVVATADTRYFGMYWANNKDMANGTKGYTGIYFNRLNAGVSVGDHKAYLNGDDQKESISTSPNPVMGRFVVGPGSDTTRINTVNEWTNGQVNESIYTLDGRKVPCEQVNSSTRQLPKGIYVMNGKKFVIK